MEMPVFKAQDTRDLATISGKGISPKIAKELQKMKDMISNFPRIIRLIAEVPEIGYLLSKGYLKELLGRDKNKNQDPVKIPERAPSPPPRAMVVSFISGGSDICGSSYFAAKKCSKLMKMDNGERPLRTSTLTTQRIISFDEGDRCDLVDPNHNALVITLGIANCFVRRILVDGGSSVNIIQLDALKKMDIPDTEIIPRSSVLWGFSEETKNTLGDIKLPV
ncbi:uncharacterized protein LOC143586073 [Bidens hawaiensis]|uniref:uncharacterized protein LOC143586073 n=1 Tax=Bidens hawaiensis TaxID=980011 RepID=UPI00404AE12C